MTGSDMTVSQRSVVLLFIVALVGSTNTAANAEDAARSHKKPTHNKYGSPLDTLMSTHLWTDVPPAQGFVTETRPDPKSLDYTPLTGKDPERPKPRDKANVEALQAELEHDGATNESKAHGLRGAAKVHAKVHAKVPATTAR